MVVSEKEKEMRREGQIIRSHCRGVEEEQEHSMVSSQNNTRDF